MIWSFVYSVGDFQRDEKPEENLIDLKLYDINYSRKWYMKFRHKTKPDNVVKDLNPTEYRETSEKAHGASNKAEGSLHCHLGIWGKNVFFFFLKH